MSHVGQRRRTRGDLRPRVLLVLGLLAGLLGMHALGPAAAVATPGHRMPVHAVQAAGPAVSVQAGCDGCGHGGGLHADHADPTCASGAVGGAGALPGPSPALRDVADAASIRAAQSGGPAVERAPPSLAELQLLRI